MARIISYIKVFRLFFYGGAIYLRLRRYLNSIYNKKLNFPESLKKDYYYHSRFYNRAQQYIHANHFFGELLSLLRGTKMRDKEMRRFVLLSSCAPVFDDFFEKDADYSSIKSLMHQPELERAKNDNEKLAAYFFSELLMDLNNRDQVLKAADQLFEAQLKSKIQTNSQMSSNDLLQISLDKGGYSGLMYGLLLEHKQSESFNQIAFSLGSYGQLMDDVFDLYDDAHNGIRTFANQASSVRDIRMITEEHEQKIFNLIDKMHCSGKSRKMFEQVLLVFSSIIDIALNQYEQIEIKMQITPHECIKLERKYWIVDMEKVSNVWKLFKFSSQRI